MKYSEDCKLIKKLRFDFYLPEKDIFIEFDGEQHFKPSMFGGKESGEEKLQRTVINDKIKNEYCEKNKIKLIRIKYDEDLQNKLEEIKEMI